MNYQGLLRILNLTRGILACVAGLIAIRALAAVQALDDISVSLTISLIVALALSWPYTGRVFVLVFAGAGVVGLTSALLNSIVASGVPESILAFAIVKISYLIPIVIWLVTDQLKKRGLSETFHDQDGNESEASDTTSSKSG